MRKAIILLLAIIAFQFANAQEFRFGLTASPEFNFAGVKADNVNNDGARIGFNYGFLADFTLGTNERYAFSTGFTHRLAGYNLSQEVPDTANPGGKVSAHETIKLQYIEIPLTIRLRTNEIGYITYYGQFGLVPGLLVSSRINQSYASPYNDDNRYPKLNFEDKKIGKDLNGEDIDTENAGFFNLSLHFGIGLEYSLGGATALMGGLYYNNGFLNTYTPVDELNQNSELARNEAIKLSNFGLRIGVLF
jgi:hypothetical protein